MNETNTKTYLVAQSNLAELTRKLDKLVRKSAKLGVGEITYKLGKTVDRPYYRGLTGIGQSLSEDPKALAAAEASGRVVYIRFQEVEVTGATPRLAGWNFIATLQHMTDDKGEVINLLRTVPSFQGQLPEKYRNATPENCDHCQKAIRTRKETFIVQHEDGTWKQVGRNCTQDFLGGKDPHQVAAYLNLVLFLFETAEGFGGGFGTGEKVRFDMETFLSVVATLVRREGWTSRGKARQDESLRATADATWSYLTPPLPGTEAYSEWKAWVDENPVEAEDTEVAEKAMDYAREELVNKASRSDYEHNLYVATLQPTVDFKLAGITASLVPYYLREVERRVIREAEVRRVKDSQFQGVEGEKLVGVSVSVAKIIRIESQYGTSFLHRLITGDGNLLVWFSSNSENNLNPGQTYIIKGTVKRHEERQGVKQTVLTRLTTMTQADVEKEAKKAARAAKKAEKAAAANENAVKVQPELDPDW